jgi:PqqD family protein of HPr-rel-A system
VSTGWRAAFPLERRDLDGEIVAYSDVTGDTFKVAPIARAVLDAVSVAPADMPALAAATAQALAVDRSAVETAVAETIEDLESLGIVERVSL